MACCVLHNIATKRGVPVSPPPSKEHVRPDALLGPGTRQAVHIEN